MSESAPMPDQGPVIEASGVGDIESRERAIVTTESMSLIGGLALSEANDRSVANNDIVLKSEGRHPGSFAAELNEGSESGGPWHRIKVEGSNYDLSKADQDANSVNWLRKTRLTVDSRDTGEAAVSRRGTTIDSVSKIDKNGRTDKARTVSGGPYSTKVDPDTDQLLHKVKFSSDANKAKYNDILARRAAKAAQAAESSDYTHAV